MTVRLHIDRVVLDGIELGAGGEHEFQAALRDQLAAALASDRTMASRGSRELESLRCAGIQLSTPGDGASVGTAAAQALATGLGPT